MYHAFWRHFDIPLPFLVTRCHTDLYHRLKVRHLFADTITSEVNKNDEHFEQDVSNSVKSAFLYSIQCAYLIILLKEALVFGEMSSYLKDVIF